MGGRRYLLVMLLALSASACCSHKPEPDWSLAATAGNALARTTYRDPMLPGNPVRTGTTARGESALDAERYLGPLEKIHGSGLHGWGVASGLSVLAEDGRPDVKVLPGVALDVYGRHISLAEGGQAEMGANPDNPGEPPLLAAVTAGGVAKATAGLSGPNYLTMQWRETFDAKAYNNYGIYRMDHTPWIRLIPVEGFNDDGSLVVIACLTLDAAGNVTALTPELRRSTSLPAGRIELRTSNMESTPPKHSVDDRLSGEIRGLAQGGIQLTVPNATDEIHLEGAGGSFAKMSIAADSVVVRARDGEEQLVLDTPNGDILLRGFPNPRQRRYWVHVKQIVPLGTILDWFRFDAVTPLPYGYKICDGTPIEDEDSPFFGMKVPSLLDRFAMGVSADRVGEEGGTNAIKEEGPHNHGDETYGTTNDGRTFDDPDGNDDARRATKHDHQHRIRPSGAHDHGGDNRPKYVGVLKIMRIK